MDQNLYVFLLEAYNSYDLVTFENCNIPQAPTHQREKEFLDLRENKLAHILNFTYPDIDNVVFDFMVNGYKVQEKVCRYCKNTCSVTTTVTKNYQRKGKYCLKGPYDKGDNNFYWFHHPNKLCFYVLPEDMLSSWGKLREPNSEGKRSIILYPYITQLGLQNKMTKDANAYLFFYNDLDITKLKGLFGVS